MIEQLANAIGADRAALALIISLLLSYPFAYLYRLAIEEQANYVKQLYFLGVGLGCLYLQWFNDAFYVLVSVIVTYVILLTFGQSKIGIQVSWFFNMGYMLTAYYYYETENYDINWTTSQCVMCLRMIAISFDYYDGGREGLSNDQIENNLKELPSFIDFIGFSFFFPAVHCGPLVQFRKFKEFMTSTTGPSLKECIPPASVAFGKGLSYLILFQIFDPVFPQSFYYTEAFQNESSILYQIAFMMARGFPFFFKYFSCWKFAEGACTLIGISFVKYGDDKEIIWGMQNIKSLVHHRCLLLSDIVKCFNINTNKWALQYVYKRLRFLNNRYISQFGTLMFLALWHGLHINYFFAFFLEFIEMHAEKQYIRVFAPVIEFVNSEKCPKIVYYLGVLLVWCVRIIGLHNGAMVFEILNLGKSWEVQKSMYFANHWIWIVGCFLTFAPSLGKKKVKAPVDVVNPKVIGKAKTE